MRVLQIMTRKNYPVSDGGQKCVLMHSRLLKHLGAELYGVMGNTEDACLDWKGHMHDFSDVIAFQRNHVRFKKNPIRALLEYALSGKPRGGQVLSSDKNKNYVMEFILSKNINFIFLESPYASEYIDMGTLKEKGVRVVVFAHNAEYMFQSSLLSKYGFLSRIEVRRTYDYEGAVLRKADKVISISPDDCDLLRQEFHLNNISYMPTPYFRSESRWEETGSDYIVFNGSLDFYPNYVGMKNFIEYIFPPFSRRHPHVKLYITGKNKESIRSEFQSPNIKFTGFLSDTELDEILMKCLFLVAPITIGSGTKMKLVQALSMGIPTIASKHCYDGVPYDIEDSSCPYFVANDNEKFLKYMEFLLEDERERKELSKRGDLFFMNTFDYRYCAPKWKRALFSERC